MMNAAAIEIAPASVAAKPFVPRIEVIVLPP
jgi:hypothetical protein